jgi:predicted nucleic acid-binding protein
MPLDPIAVDVNVLVYALDRDARRQLGQEIDRAHSLMRAFLGLDLAKF